MGAASLCGLSEELSIGFQFDIGHGRRMLQTFFATFGIYLSNDGSVKVAGGLSRGRFHSSEKG
jgi:hypothetical protein